MINLSKKVKTGPTSNWASGGQPSTQYGVSSANNSMVEGLAHPNTSLNSSLPLNHAIEPRHRRGPSDSIGGISRTVDRSREASNALDNDSMENIS